MIKLVMEETVMSLSGEYKIRLNKETGTWEKNLCNKIDYNLLGIYNCNRHTV